MVPPRHDPADSRETPAHEVMATLRELTAGDESLLGEVLASFLATVAERIATLRQAADHGDAEGLAAAAHTLRGLASQLNARDLAELSHQLETAGLRRSVDGAGPVIERLAARLGELRQLLVDDRRGKRGNLAALDRGGA